MPGTRTNKFSPYKAISRVPSAELAIQKYMIANSAEETREIAL